MQDMSVVEIKAFVPSKDFALSKRFYQDFGFNLGWSSDHSLIFTTGVQLSLAELLHERTRR
jgi:hypothetical protein